MSWNVVDPRLYASEEDFARDAGNRRRVADETAARAAPAAADGLSADGSPAATVAPSEDDEGGHLTGQYPYDGCGCCGSPIRQPWDGRSPRSVVPGRAPTYPAPPSHGPPAAAFSSG